MTRIIADLPIGVDVHLVSDQPQIVDEAVSGFTRALFEAVVIVLAISFISLGMRAGLVVAISIPLVLAITFLVMAYSGISLQRISLGALIIALGLLVDDAMIAVEMMVARLEVGDTLAKAATYVYTSTAFPMLTGTLVTVAGFIPIGLQQQRGRRIHLHPVRRDRRLADRVLDRRGAVHAAARRDPAAENDEGASRKEGLVRARVFPCAWSLHALALAHDRRDAGGVRAVGRRHAASSSSSSSRRPTATN